MATTLRLHYEVHIGFVQLYDEIARCGTALNSKHIQLAA